jgi:hypothetical protein
VICALFNGGKKVLNLEMMCDKESTLKLNKNPESHSMSLFLSELNPSMKLRIHICLE